MSKGPEGREEILKGRNVREDMSGRRNRCKGVYQMPSIEGREERMRERRSVGVEAK